MSEASATHPLTGSRPQPAASAAGRSRWWRRLGIGRFELAVLGLLVLCSCAVLLDSIQISLREHGVLWGADSPVIGDTAQYLALVRDAAQGVLVGNPFDMRPDLDSLLHPGWVLTGGLTALGLSPGLALLLFKPVALAAVFLGAHLYTRRLLAERFQRRVALVLSLFALSPLLATIDIVNVLRLDGVPYAGTVARQYISIGRELMPIAQLLGYPWAAITVGLMPLVLLAYERGRRAEGRYLALAAAGLALCCWLHPWQGATVWLVIAAVEIAGALGRLRARAANGLTDVASRGSGSAAPAPRAIVARLLRRTVPVLAVGALPLVYFFLLNVFDSDYRRLGLLLDGGFWRPQVLAAALLPVAIPALLAYRLPARSFQEAAVRWWPPLALLVYVQPGGTFRNHAVEGLALPLAVLAVTGLAALPWPRWRPVLSSRAAVLGAVALFCIPAAGMQLLIAHTSVRDPDTRPYLLRGEADALHALDADPRPGGVLAPGPITLLVPGLTGREIWSSGLIWTPNAYQRSAETQRLFEGRLRPGQAQRLVGATGARFLLADCHGVRPDLRPALGGLIARTREFGCARLYELR